MKKIYSYLLGLAALAAPAAADANVVTINIDNPEAVTVTREGYDYNAGGYITEDLFDPIEEVNQYTYDAGTTVAVYIRAKEGYKIMSMINNGMDVLYGNAYAYISCSDMNSGQVYTINTADLSEIRTATATFNIDDVSKVRLSYGGSGGEITTLVDGANTIKFDPASEGRFQIGSKEYNSPIYSVKLDGTNVAESYGNWYVDCTDGSVVDIQAAWPDESYIVKINVPADCPDIISSVKNGSTNEDIEGDFTKGVALKSGTSISIQVNNSVYAIDKFSINGEPQTSFYGSWSGRVRDTDLTFDVEGHPFGTFDVTLNVNDASAVKAYKASYAQTDAEIAITDGDNTISYQEAQYASYYLYLQPQGDNVLNSVTIRHAGSDEVTDGSNTIQVQPGDIITVEAGPKVRDKQFILWIDEAAMPNIASVKASFFDYNTYSDVVIYDGPFEAGNNIVKYSQIELPFNLNVATKHPETTPEGYMPWQPYMFVNDLSEGQTNILYFNTDNLHDGDVVRVFNEQPTLALVTVQLADDTDADNFEVLYDGQPVADWAEDGEFTAFAGSAISVKWTAPEVEEGFFMTHTCTLDGEPLEADDNNVCSFNVAGNCTLLLAEQKNVSVENVSADAVAADNAVYNLHGIRVADNASDLDRLPAGIYICGGKKVVVK